MSNEDKYRDYLKRVTADLRSTKQNLKEVRDRATEPIAIIGMSCRFPGGVDSPEQLWDLVLGDGDAIGPLPTDRGWPLDTLYDPDPDTPGRSYVTESGFLGGAAEFDAPFFGISPREALAMDPQQRLLLETSWEAVERAGIIPETLRGSSTCVFVGMSAHSYGSGSPTIPSEVEGHVVTGVAPAVASGRIAYTLGLEGPAMTVDTACSSALVSLHLACESLRRGETNLALTGAAAVIASPTVFSEYSRQRALAPDGRCKSFSDDADGTSWSEGAGMLVLERLSDARRNGHEVLAVIRGSALNQDGASNGLTAPHGPSQHRVIEAALSAAQVAPGQVDMVEAHGTATPLGDPIEAQTLVDVYGRDRDPERPLWFGSLKSNIGHAQAAAGVGGIIKAVLALRHGVMPRTLHVDAPTREVDWGEGQVRLLTEAMPWPEGDRPRRAAVSAFGMSGTNAHVVLQHDARTTAPEVRSAAGAPPDSRDPAPQTATAGSGKPSAVPVVLSAKSPAALSAQADRLRSFLRARPQAQPADVAWSLATTRSLFHHRAAVLAADRDTLLDGLDVLATGERLPLGVVSDVAAEGGMALMFPGQGGQWAGMARDLMAESPVFADSLRACAEVMDELVDWRLQDVVAGTDGHLLDRIDVVQPALFAVMVSLARLWQSWGVRVDAVVGHSQGEIAAACVSGALTLKDAARVAVTRSRLIVELSGKGRALSVGLSAPHALERLAPWGDELSLAAVNGPDSVVVSGASEALRGFAAKCKADGVWAWWIEVDFASHSAAVEEIRDELLAAIAGIEPVDGTVPLYSTVTGTRLAGHELDAGYWYRNLRQTVLFQDAVEALASDGFRFFVEASPHPLLAVGVQQTLEAVRAPGVPVGTLRRDIGGLDRALLSLLEAHVAGLPVDWSRVLAPGERLPLPTYAFRHEHYWLVPPVPVAPGKEADTGFWDAVEREDIERLSAELGTEDGLRAVVPALARWRRRNRLRSELDEWRYRIGWIPVARPQEVPRLPGRWLVAGSISADEHGLERLFEEVVRLPLEGADRFSLATALAAVGALDGVLCRSDHAEHVLALVQTLGDIGITAPLWCVTRQAVSTGSADALRSPQGAAVWGLGRVVSLEHPERWGGLIDLPGVLGEREVALLGGVLGAGGAEDQLAVRPDGVWARRLMRAHEGVQGTRPWRPSGTVLVTGGTGAVGGHVARWLAAHGDCSIVLLSRRGAEAPGAAELLAELHATGTPARAVAADVADRDAVATLLRQLADDGAPVRSVFHAAGVGQSTSLAEMSPREFADVVSAKIDGARILDELLDGTELDAFVVFSSISAVWGSSFSGAYAAGNAYLDALVAQRRARGAAGTSVAWGIWADAGMVDRDTAQQLRRIGVGALKPAQAIASLQRTLEDDEADVTVADVDWVPFTASYTAVRRRPLIEDLPQVRAAQTAVPETRDTAAEAFRRELSALEPAAMQTALLDLVRNEVAAELAYPDPAQVEPGRSFRDLGLDSLASVGLRKRLNSRLGVDTPVTLAFDHPSPTAIAAFLQQLLTVEGASGTGTADEEFDRLEAALAAFKLDSVGRSRISMRLANLLTRWKAGEEAAPIPADADVPGGRLDDATDEELLAMLGSEFDIS
ncbi:type I polyketide synthase [Streptomyces sp. NPDC051677]|uniref:type I polyketide synthase n=1 Tax=Streptomyces sp. NPDC051677 TaxID=3365669 RepID=UPI0037D67672